MVSELYLLALGRNDQLDLLRDRFRELGHAEPNEDDKILERVYGGPTDRTLADYPTRRKQLLLAMLEHHGDNLDAAADELGLFFDHLRQVGIRGFVAEKANDADYMLPAKKPTTRSRRTDPTRRDRSGRWPGRWRGGQRRGPALP
jgi:hypothetical protein